jgi:hypothetical protein
VLAMGRADSYLGDDPARTRPKITTSHGHRSRTSRNRRVGHKPAAGHLTFTRNHESAFPRTRKFFPGRSERFRR